MHSRMGLVTLILGGVYVGVSSISPHSDVEAYPLRKKWCDVYVWRSVFGLVEEGQCCVLPYLPIEYGLFHGDGERQW